MPWRGALGSFVQSAALFGGRQPAPVGNQLPKLRLINNARGHAPGVGADFLTANPEAKAKEVVEALGKTGVKTNEGLVYAVKGGMKEKKRRKKRVAKAAMAAVSKVSSNGQASKPDAITMIRGRAPPPRPAPQPAGRRPALSPQSSCTRPRAARRCYRKPRCCRPGAGGRRRAPELRIAAPFVPIAASSEFFTGCSLEDR